MTYAKTSNITGVCSANQAYRARSRFLSALTGKKELSDYVQELRTLIAAMQLDLLPEIVLVTIFMEGFARAWLERKYSGYTPPPLIGLWISRWMLSSTLRQPVLAPMGTIQTRRTTLVHSKGRSLWASVSLRRTKKHRFELQISVKTFDDVSRAESTKHLRPSCPLLRARQATSGRTPAPKQKSGTVRENVDSQ